MNYSDKMIKENRSENVKEVNIMEKFIYKKIKTVFELQEFFN